MGIRFRGQEGNQEIGEMVAEEIRKFIKKVSIKSFAALGIVKKDLIAITPVVFKDACYNFVPKELKKEDVEVILGNMYENYQ
jgi:alcohol dehydrogenase class IV